MDMGKGKGRFRSAFSFFWDEVERMAVMKMRTIIARNWCNCCKKAQKKIIPTVPFAFIIPLACLASPNLIIPSFWSSWSAGNGPYLIQSVLPVIHLFCHVLRTHPPTLVSFTQAHALYLLRMMLAFRCIFDVCKRFIAFLEERIPRFAAEVKHKCIKIHEVLCILT